MRNILLIILFSFSFHASGAIIETESQKEKNKAVAIYLDESSSDSLRAQSILIFEKYAAYDANMLYYLGRANYDEVTSLLKLNKHEGKKMIEKAAVKGSDIAEYAYAMILLEENKLIEGVKYLKDASKDGNRDAQYQLGKMYYKGNGVPKSKTNGFKLILSSAQKDQPFAQYDIAKIFFSQSEESVKKNGVTWLTRAVINGNNKACSELYKLYYSGLLVAQDRKKHIEYLICSAKYGDNDARILLANYYEKGNYIKMNHHKAAYWNLELAKEGDDAASVKYAKYIFSYHKNNKSKIQEAMTYLDKSSESYTESAMMLGHIFKGGLYGNLKNPAKAITHFENAKNLGNEDAQKEIIAILNSKSFNKKK